MSDGWQEIETAPKDGTEILAAQAGADEISVVRWVTKGATGTWVACADGRRAVEYMSDFGTDYVEPFVTHWMPLPTPPETTDG